MRRCGSWRGSKLNPYRRPTSSTISSGIARSVRQNGTCTTIRSSLPATVTSTLPKICFMALRDSSSPSRLLIISPPTITWRGRLPTRASATSLVIASYTGLAITAPASAASCKKYCKTCSFCSGDWPLLYLVSASVNTPCRIALLRSANISKVATSITTRVVSSVTAVSLPPIMPARPTGFSVSAITISSAVNTMSLPSSSVSDSPSCAWRATSVCPASLS